MSPTVVIIGWQRGLIYITGLGFVGAESGGIVKSMIASCGLQQLLKHRNMQKVQEALEVGAAFPEGPGRRGVDPRSEHRCGEAVPNSSVRHSGHVT